MAAHYGTVVIPARPRRPEDKAKVEAGVQMVERWILARLRNRTFFSLAELNQAIAELLEELNNRPFQKLEGSRRSLFETLDRPALKPLPAQPYEFAQWKKAKVNIDCHVEVEHNWYSAPHQLVGKEVDVRLTGSMVEILHGGRRVASHPRSYRKGQYITDQRHLPAAHQKHLQWSPSRLIRWAATVGPNTAELVKAILEARPHPEQGYRSCLGIMRLGKEYGHSRLEAAAERAVRVKAYSFGSVQSILRQGLDQLPLEQPDRDAPAPLGNHAHVRGPGYYQH